VAALTLLLEAGADPALAQAGDNEGPFDVAKNDACRDLLAAWDPEKTVRIVHQKWHVAPRACFAAAASVAHLDLVTKSGVSPSQRCRVLNLRPEMKSLTSIWWSRCFQFIDLVEHACMSRLRTLVKCEQHDSEYTGVSWMYRLP
jgi:hypothetical protein